MMAEGRRPAAFSMGAVLECSERTCLLKTWDHCTMMADHHPRIQLCQPRHIPRYCS